MTLPPRITDALVTRVVNRSRHTGAPLIGCLLNIEVADVSDDGAGLSVDEELSTVTGLLDVAVAVDFALGYSVRQATQETGWAVPTVDLSLQMSVDLPAHGAVRVAVSPAVVHPSGFLGAARGVVHTSSGVPVAQCSALFALPRRQAVEPLPWELASSERSAHGFSVSEETTDAGGAVRVICEAFALTGVGGSWLDTLLGLVAPARMRGQQIECRFLEPAVVANRAGYVQGAVLFALAAVKPLSGESAALVSADMKFVRPVRAVSPLLIEPTVESRGRRVEFLSSRLYQDGSLVGVGSYVFRRS